MPYNYKRISVEGMGRPGYRCGVRPTSPNGLAAPNNHETVDGLDLARDDVSGRRQRFAAIRHAIRRPALKLADVAKRAFAMPLTDPAYPRGPYEFYNR
jgi:hypothetical protein